MLLGHRKGNRIEVDGDVANVHIVRKSGEAVVAMVDADDVGRVARFTWTAQWSCRGHRFYIITNATSADGKRKTMRLHRYLVEAPAGMEVDHRNRDGLDNRKANLRVCTRGENMANQATVGGVSRFKGVKRQGGGWQARITVAGRHLTLGTRGTEEQAARLYDEAARRYFGEFARLNLPDRAHAIDRAMAEER